MLWNHKTENGNMEPIESFGKSDYRTSKCKELWHQATQHDKDWHFVECSVKRQNKKEHKTFTDWRACGFSYQLWRAGVLTNRTPCEFPPRRSSWQVCGKLKLAADGGPQSKPQKVVRRAQSRDGCTDDPNARKQQRLPVQRKIATEEDASAFLWREDL
jgi:hypothetical protein